MNDKSMVGEWSKIFHVIMYIKNILSECGIYDFDVISEIFTRYDVRFLNLLCSLHLKI